MTVTVCCVTCGSEKKIKPGEIATGDQPMQSVDGRYVIVFNGEIFNYIELFSLQFVIRSAFVK